MRADVLHFEWNTICISSKVVKFLTEYVVHYLLQSLENSSSGILYVGNIEIAEDYYLCFGRRKCHRVTVALFRTLTAHIQNKIILTLMIVFPISLNLLLFPYPGPHYRVFYDPAAYCIYCYLVHKSKLAFSYTFLLYSV